MSQAFRLVAFSLFIASSYQDVEGQEVSLIQDEEVSATVVLPDFPSRIEKHAGQLFCRYLAMMANQSLVPSPIRESEFTSNSGQSVVLIGKSESNQIIHQMVKKGLFRLSQDSPGGDGIVVKTIYDQQTNYLVIGGSSDRAVLYATTHFLEQTGKVGVFWDGEYIPKRKSWKVTNLSINENPTSRCANTTKDVFLPIAGLLGSRSTETSSGLGCVEETESAHVAWWHW